jgi:hypothetical protein
MDADVDTSAFASSARNDGQYHSYSESTLYDKSYHHRYDRAQIALNLSHYLFAFAVYVMLPLVHTESLVPLAF